MKIGIYDDGTVARRGGGFTFKNEIIHGIANSQCHPDDDIFLFHWHSSGRSEMAREDRVPSLVITEPYYLRCLEFIKKTVHKSLKRALLASQKERRQAIINPSINAMNVYARFRSKILARQLLAYGADLIIYMEAQEIITFRIPYICISWDLAHLYTPYFPETNFEHWQLIENLKRVGLQRAVRVVVGTQLGKEQIHAQYQIPRQRISVLPFPTPSYLLKEMCDGLRERHTGFHSPPKRDFLFYPASYWPHKNHYLLIEAMREIVNEKHIDIDLVLCGSDKGNKPYIRQLIDEYELSDRVHTFDFLERGEINYLYTKALALVFPTHIGPDNLPPLEAFGLGCPVIASEVDGAREQLGSSALLFDPFDAKDLVEKILRIRGDDTKRRQLIESGRQRADSWTSNDYAGALVSLVDEYRPYHRCYDLQTYRTMFA